MLKKMGIFSIFIAVIIFSCKDNPSSPDNNKKRITIEGTVSTISGRRLDSVMIYTYPETDTVYSDENGGFKIEDIWEEKYLIVAKKENFKTDTTDLFSVDSEVVKVAIIMELGAFSLNGEVISQNGKSLDSVSIFTIPRTQNVISDSNGNFQINDISPGEYWVFAEKDHYKSDSMKINVQDSALKTITFTLNSVPIPKIFTNNKFGDIHTVFDFDGSQTVDPIEENSSLEVRWDWENDGVWDTDFSVDKNISHTFSLPGFKTVVMQARNPLNEVQEDSIQILVVPEILAHFDFNGDFQDKSIHQNFATPMNGPIFVPDRHNIQGNAVGFDGLDDYIDYGSAEILKPQFPFAVSTWIKCVANTPITIFNNDFNGERYYGIQLLTSFEQQFSVLYGNGDYFGPAARYQKTANTALSIQQWYHLMVVFESSSKIELYVNGKNANGFYSGYANEMVYNNGKAVSAMRDVGRWEPESFTPFILDDLMLIKGMITADNVKFIYDMQK